MNTCLCGCGIEPRPGNRYINGHNRRKSPIEYIIEDRGYVTPCWIWQKASNARGYGWMRVGGRPTGAHRRMYERHRGPIPPGLEPDHLCRVRICVNPDHLELVTRKENARRGARTKLTADDVRQIRALDGLMTQGQIGSRFGIAGGYVSRIQSRLAWDDVE